MNKLLVLLLFSVLLSCKKDEAGTSDPVEELPKKDTVIAVPKESVIEISTVFGQMYMWLYKETPKHRANFLKLAKEHYFDGTTFHRVVSGFVVQGGDPNSRDSDTTNDGEGGPPYTIPAEISDTIRHKRGAVGAAREGDDINPDRESSGSQFYICLSATGTSSLNKKYTVFGFIMKGMQFADSIVRQPKNGNDRPYNDIFMQVKVLDKTKEEILSEYGYAIPQ